MSANIDAKISPKIDEQELKKTSKKMGDGLERAGKQASKQLEKELKKRTKKGAKEGTKKGITEGAKEGLDVFKGSFFGSLLGNIAGSIGSVIADGIMEGLQGAEEIVERLRARFDENARINTAAQSLGVDAGELYKINAAWKVANPNEDISGLLGVFQQLKGALATDQGSEYRKYAEKNGLIATLLNVVAKAGTIKDQAERANFEGLYLGEDDAIKMQKLSNVAVDFYKKNNKIPTADDIGKIVAGIDTSSRSITNKLQEIAAGQEQIAKHDAQIALNQLMGTSVKEQVRLINQMASIDERRQKFEEATLGQRVAWADYKEWMSEFTGQYGSEVLEILNNMNDMFTNLYKFWTGSSWEERAKKTVNYVEKNTPAILTALNPVGNAYNAFMGGLESMGLIEGEKAEDRAVAKQGMLIRKDDQTTSNWRN